MFEIMICTLHIVDNICENNSIDFNLNNTVPVNVSLFYFYLGSA